MQQHTNMLPKDTKTFNIHALLSQKVAAFLSLLLIVVFFSFASPYFFDIENFITIMQQSAVIGIMGIGVTFVIISAGIDLSIGSIVGFGGVLVAQFVNATQSIFLSILLTLFFCLIIGLVNGGLVSFAGIPPFIATLGMMMMARGITLVLTNAIPVYFPKEISFDALANMSVLSIPLGVWYFILSGVVAGFILSRLVIGKHIFCVGSNEEASRLSGVSIPKIKLFVYSASALLSGFAGIILASRLNSGQPSAGTSYELNAIAAAVIGGTSLMGGEGTVLGTIIGAMIMGVLQNGLNLVGVSQFWQQFIIGLVVVVAVFIDMKRKKNKTT